MHSSVKRPCGPHPWLPCALLILSVAANGHPAAHAEHSNSTFSVATYNARFLMDVFDDPYTHDEEHEPKKQRELALLAKTIRQLNADIVAFQEVENEGTLKAFSVEHLPGMGYRQVGVLATNSLRGQNLGILSRHPILSITGHRHRPLALPDDPRRWHFARDLMHVRLRVAESHELHLFVVHLKSKHDSEGDAESADWRLAEAIAVRRIMAETMATDPDGWYLLVGDMNDLPLSLPLQTLRGSRDALPLIDLHRHLPASQRVTYLWGRYRSTIDYILASPALAVRSVPQSARVLTDKSMLRGSDHAPVVAEFSFTLP